MSAAPNPQVGAALKKKFVCFPCQNHLILSLLCLQGLLFVGPTA